MKIGKFRISFSVIVATILMLGILIYGDSYIRQLESHYSAREYYEEYNKTVATKYNDDNDKTILEELNEKSYIYTIPTLNKDGMVGVFIVGKANSDISNSVLIDRKLIEQNAMKTVKQYRLMLIIFSFIYAFAIGLSFWSQYLNKRKIEEMAYVDEITGGKSFNKFKLDVDELLKSTSHEYVLVDLDVDKFKFINDIFGYEAGNATIRRIWEDIGSFVQSDEVYARQTADRFVMLLKADDMDAVIKRLEDMSEKICKKEDSGLNNYEIELSIGIYPVERRNFKLNSALDRVSLTKKSIKGQHNRIYAVYDEKLREQVLKDQEIENMMEDALKNHEFLVYYQPKYDSATCEPVGAEALVRWYNEEVGMIYPSDFIPVFERNGFIAQLDAYMFESVCKDIRMWLDEGCVVVPVSVNLSQLQLYNTRFISEYKKILAKYNIPPGYVQLEITETTLFSEVTMLTGIIDKLHKEGFSILMDDFGTGYSSLNMLKNVSVDILKLDKSFVDDIGDAKGDIVVSTIVSLGQSLNMRIVAEGVETKEQFEFLRDIFCDEIQGYYFSKPIPADEYGKLMSREA